MHQGGRQPRHQGEPEVLEVDPHGPGRQLGLLGRGHEVDRELLPRLELGTQPHLAQGRGGEREMKQTRVTAASCLVLGLPLTCLTSDLPAI